MERIHDTHHVVVRRGHKNVSFAHIFKHCIILSCLNANNSTSETVSELIFDALLALDG